MADTEVVMVVVDSSSSKGSLEMLPLRSHSAMRRRRVVTIVMCIPFVYMLFAPDHAQAEDVRPSSRLPSTLSESLLEDVQFLKEETVVTAMRYEQPISESPSNIYVITAEDIQRSGATDLPTILRRVPGMEVMQTTGAEFNVSVRGDNQLFSNKLLVLVDGRSIFLDVQGLVKWKLLPVPLLEIQRVEVLLGPASAVYGFNAFDGVVNIITKAPEEIDGTIFSSRWWRIRDADELGYPWWPSWRHWISPLSGVGSKSTMACS